MLEAWFSMKSCSTGGQGPLSYSAAGAEPAASEVSPCSHGRPGLKQALARQKTLLDAGTSWSLFSSSSLVVPSALSRAASRPKPGVLGLLSQLRVSPVRAQGSSSRASLVHWQKEGPSVEGDQTGEGVKQRVKYLQGELELYMGLDEVQSDWEAMVAPGCLSVPRLGAHPQSACGPPPRALPRCVPAHPYQLCCRVLCRAVSLGEAEAFSSVAGCCGSCRHIVCPRM